MKRLIQTLKNIWSIEDLRGRILLTLGLVAVYRFGSYVVLPGIDAAQLAEFTSRNAGGGILGIINAFAGGAFARASVFALGIMPYISASIAMQLLGLAVPYFQKMQKEGESGRRRFNQITRVLTVLVTGFQAAAYVTYVTSTAGQAIVIPTGLFWLSTVVTLTAGTIFCMWLGEKITDRGIGNGISLLIMIGIIANLPFASLAELTARLDSGQMIEFILELAIMAVIVLATIALVQATRRIPVNFAKQQVARGGRMLQMGAPRRFIPLKVNASGVMPIIFAQALMFIPSVVAQAFPNSNFMASLQAGNMYTSFWYNFIFFMLIVLFTYFYTALIINPQQMAEDLKRNGGFIPGVKPGKKTMDFIDTIMSRITLPGSIFLGLVAILPAFAVALGGVQPSFGDFFGGTSLLILVAVVLDTLQQIESHLLMRKYDGLTKKGRIKGRAGAVGASM